MKITAVEIIPIYPRLAKRYAHRSVDLYGIDHRIVYKVTKALYDHADELRSGGVHWRRYDRALIAKDLGVTHHPGAVKYFREKGLIK